ncbi:MAG: hypothetical protein M3066_03680, partial [Actinomycetota bacterium]|nr:hypothetical protein [Actinomycetota bacterium]
MGRYFGREPHYSQQEADAQAQAAIDAAVKKGRPPADEWKGLSSRMGDINRELATRPPVEIPPPPPPRRAETDRGEPGAARRPRVVSQILAPRPPPAPGPEPIVAPSAAPTPAKRTPRASAAAAATRPPPATRPARASAPAAAPTGRATK